MNPEQITQNLRSLIEKNTVLSYVLPKLVAANMRYGLFAGAHVAMLTSNRTPTDIDFLVYDEDFPKLRSLFPFAKTTDLGNGVFLYVGENDLAEFVSALDVIKEGNIYPFRLTDEAVGRLSSYNIDGLEIKLVDPVDSILLKSILQRGADKGKHDIEDIEAVFNTIDVDIAYLRKRLEESGGLDIATPLFHKLGVDL